MNHGLVLISPIILVRLLTVEQFGLYREFLLYCGVVVSLASFGVNTSLLRFVPHQPKYRQQFAEQALLMTLVGSLLVVGAVASLNVLFDGAIIGQYTVPVALYVLAFVNFDLWEHLWLAERKPMAVLAYTAGRLIVRMFVVIAAAALTRDVTVIIWSLVTLETTRVVASALIWARMRKPDAPRAPDGWREQLRFCGPVGAATALATLNRSMGGLYVAKVLGPADLAHFAIGTYLHPIIAVLRNSLSDALLPVMSARQPSKEADPLWLWRRTTVAAGILMIPAAIVLARFAETIVVTLFSPEYSPAVLVFQISVLVLFRETLDFAVPLRAANRTAPIMYATMISLVAHATLLAILLPRIGIVGAAMAGVLVRVIDGAYLARETAKIYGVRAGELVRWRDLGKVAGAAALASATLFGSFWTDWIGLPGVVFGGVCFASMYAALLLFFEVPEAVELAQRLGRWPRAFHTRT